MDLEEIQCPLCKEQFSEKNRVPLLLPDCGHSYCEQCIEEHSTEVGFAMARRQVITEAEQDEQDYDDEDEDLTKDD